MRRKWMIHNEVYEELEKPCVKWILGKVLNRKYVIKHWITKHDDPPNKRSASKNSSSGNKKTTKRGLKASVFGFLSSNFWILRLGSHRSRRFLLSRSGSESMSFAPEFIYTVTGLLTIEVWVQQLTDIPQRMMLCHVLQLIVAGAMMFSGSEWLSTRFTHCFGLLFVGFAGDSWSSLRNQVPHAWGKAQE